MLSKNYISGTNVRVVIDGICRYNTDNINIDTHIGIRYVILAKQWMWLPDDGFYMNRNKLGQLL